MEKQFLSAQRLFAELQGRLEDPASQIQVVCFDFFDTLVSRSVIPEDTKKIAAGQLADLLQHGISGSLIYEMRRILEQRLCAENHQKGLDPEFNLAALALRLHQGLELLVGPGVFGLPQRFASLMLEIELAVERQVQVLNSDVAEIAGYCRARGYRTVLVSDFYLPSHYFQRLLDFHGLAEAFDGLYVSADYALTKGHGGRLYEEVVRSLGIAADAMVMIGDNDHADGRMADARGLHSYCLQRPGKMETGGAKHMGLRSVAAVDEGYTAAFAAHKARFFPEMGLSLHFFTHKLFLQAVSDGYHTLFFCSKEGEFLRQLFVRYQEIRFGHQVIASHYLYVSRKATFICSCRAIESEDFNRLFVHYRDQSLLEFLQSLNFSVQTAMALCGTLHLEPDVRHHDLKNHRDFEILTRSDVFRGAYERHRSSQRTNFHHYLESYAIDFLKEGMALVDVGWKGSIQNNIYYFFDGRVKVQGYYIGLLSPTEVRPDNVKKGILFSDTPAHSPFIHVFNNNRSLFEMMLGASHGSADGYFDEVLWAAEGEGRLGRFVECSGGEAFPRVTVLDLAEERKLFNELIAPVQKKYLALHEALTALLVVADPTLPSAEWLARRHARMVFQPTKEEIDFYSGLYHLENFGLFEFTCFEEGKAPSISARIRNFRALLRDPAGHLETGVWPPIILRRLGLAFLIWLEGQKRYRTVFGDYR